jgi:hypothetical protein
MTFGDMMMRVGEKFNKDKSVPETENEDSFEGREKGNIKYFEDLLRQGANRGTIASCLSGYNSAEAWALRREIKAEAEALTKLNRVPVKNDLICGLANIDSERAWQWREEFETDEDCDYNSLAKSLIGLDSRKIEDNDPPRAWELRKKILAKLNDSDDEKYFNSPTLVKSLFISLIGVDSDEAWQLRQRLHERGGEVSDYILSLSGLDSKRADDARRQFFGQAQLYSGGNIYNSLMRSSIGIEGETINKIKVYQMRLVHAKEIMFGK